MTQPAKDKFKTRRAIIAYLVTVFAGLTTLFYTPGGLHMPQMNDGISLASAYIFVMGFAFIFLVSSPAFLVTTISLFVAESLSRKKASDFKRTLKLMTQVWTAVLVASIVIWDLFRFRSPSSSLWGNLLADLHVAAICGVAFSALLATLFLSNRSRIDNHSQ